MLTDLKLFMDEKRKEFEEALAEALKDYHYYKGALATLGDLERNFFPVPFKSPTLDVPYTNILKDIEECGCSECEYKSPAQDVSNTNVNKFSKKHECSECECSDYDYCSECTY